MMYYKLIKTIIDAAELAKININLMIRYHGLSKSIMGD